MFHNYLNVPSRNSTDYQYFAEEFGCYYHFLDTLAFVYSDLETIRGYRVILNEVNNAATNINSTIMKFVNASSTQVVVEGLALGRTYNISLLILSIHLPGPIAGPESITLTGTTYIAI